MAPPTGNEKNQTTPPRQSQTQRRSNINVRRAGSGSTTRSALTSTVGSSHSDDGTPQHGHSRGSFRRHGVVRGGSNRSLTGRTGTAATATTATTTTTTAMDDSTSQSVESFTPGRQQGQRQSSIRRQAIIRGGGGSNDSAGHGGHGGANTSLSSYMRGSARAQAERRTATTSYTAGSHNMSDSSGGSTTNTGTSYSRRPGHARHHPNRSVTAGAHTSHSHSPSHGTTRHSFQRTTTSPPSSPTRGGSPTRSVNGGGGGGGRTTTTTSRTPLGFGGLSDVDVSPTPRPPSTAAGAAAMPRPTAGLQPHISDFDIELFSDGARTTTGNQQQQQQQRQQQQRQAVAANLMEDESLSENLLAAGAGRGTIGAHRNINNNNNNNRTTGRGGAYSSRPTHRQGSEDLNNSTNLGSTFLAHRKDLREVDQSVNLMAGQFEADMSVRPPRNSKKNRQRRQTKRGSVMELFFTDQSEATKIRRKSMMEIDLGVGPTRKSIFGNALNVGPQHSMREPLWMRIENCWDSFWGSTSDCCESFWECTSECCKSFWENTKKFLPWLLLLILVAAVVVVVVIVTQEATDYYNSLPKSTPKPAPAPAAPAPSPKPSSTTADKEISSLNVVAADAASMVVDTEPVTPEERSDVIQSLVLSLGLSTPEDLADPNSASSKGIEWLAKFDPGPLMLAVTPEAVLVERFVMASFFFLTNTGILPSNTQTIPSTSSAGRRTTQQQQQQQQHQNNNNNLGSSDWMSAKSICQWKGMRCDPASGRLVEFNRTHAGLSGTLPRELAGLDQLQELDLSHNSFHGSIPEEWGEGLKKVGWLLLNDNALTGTLPDSLGEMTALYDIDLGSNQLVGSLPSSLKKLSNLRLFFMDANKLTGTIPPAMVGNFQHVEYFDLSNNALEGELPFELFSKMKKLVDVRVENNALTGTLPPELESMHHLAVMTLGKNQLGGALPDIFDRVHYLEDLDLHSNKFVGQLPPSIGKLKYLERLNLAHNSFMGTIPTDWGASLTSLQSLLLPHNDITGKVPDQICSLKKNSNNSNKNKNGLQQLKTDCLDKVSCSCCDQCY